jgi:nonsense-mediated mRNA decay protein 3
MFCIKCGKKANIGVFCDSCFLQQNELFKISNLKIFLCDCGSYFGPSKKWQKWDRGEEELLKHLIKNHIKTENKILKTDVKLKQIGNRYMVTVRCIGFVPPSKKEKTEKKEIMIDVKRRKCENCSKILGGYYEAVLQVRGPKWETILREISEKEKEDISLMEKTKNGYDVKFLKKNTADKIAMRLKKKGFSLKVSYKLVGEKKSKKLYRNFYSVR